MNPVFSIRKVLKDAFNAVVDNFKTLGIRMLQMYFYLLLLCLPLVLFFGQPIYIYDIALPNMLGMTWPISFTIGSVIVFLCYINLHVQYQKCVWRALHNQEMPSFKLKDFSISVVGLALLLSLIIISGYVLLVIPGIYFSLRFGYALPIFSVEHLSIMDSLRKSWSLTRGHAMKLLGLSVIVMMLRPFSFITYPFAEAITMSAYKQLVDVASRH